MNHVRFARFVAAGLTLAGSSVLTATAQTGPTASPASRAATTPATTLSTKPTTSPAMGPASAPAVPAMPPDHVKAHGGKPDDKKAPSKPVKKVDINNASVAELKSQLALDEEYAKKIVAHRPYKSKGELVTKAGLPEGVYHAVKRKIEMRTPRAPAK